MSRETSNRSRQFRLGTGEQLEPNVGIDRIELYNEDGSPVVLGEGGGGAADGVGYDEIQVNGETMTKTSVLNLISSGAMVGEDGDGQTIIRFPDDEAGYTAIFVNGDEVNPNRGVLDLVGEGITAEDVDDSITRVTFAGGGASPRIVRGRISTSNLANDTHGEGFNVAAYGSRLGAVYVTYDEPFSDYPVLTLQNYDFGNELGTIFTPYNPGFEGFVAYPMRWVDATNEWEPANVNFGFIAMEL